MIGPGVLKVKVFLVTRVGDVHTSFIKKKKKISLWVYLNLSRKGNLEGFLRKIRDCYSNVCD